MGGSTFVKRITSKYSQRGGRNSRMTRFVNRVTLKKSTVKVQLDGYSALCIRVFGSIDFFQSSRRSQNLPTWECPPEFAHPAAKCNHARPISNHSFGVFSPSTMERTTGSALEKSGNRRWGMFSLVQYVARSFSPFDFSFTNRTSACLAAERSGKPAN